MSQDEIPRPDPSGVTAGDGPTRVVAGIDEAGLGPLLGPLVFGWSVFRTPMDASDDLWKLLQDVVATEPRLDKTRLIVADSKKVYSRNERGLRRLENTVLAFLAQTGRANTSDAGRSARSLMLDGELSPDHAGFDRHPWYAHLESLPVIGDGGALELKAERLRRALVRAQVEVLSLGVRVIPAGELNASFAETGNKSASVWHRLEEILQLLWTRFGPAGLRVVVDRQGGRWHYGPLLGRGFPDASVRLLTEAPGFSEFELIERNPSGASPRRMRLAFAERAEDVSFAVALASCAAKYSRELAMRAFNAYFEELQPGLAPTAGYRQDGHRWLRDAREALGAASVAPELLQRTR